MNARLVVVALVLAIGGCDTGSSTAPPAAPTAATRSAAAPSSAASSAASGKSPRGNRIKALGEPAYDFCAPGSTDPNTCALEFTLTKITECKGAPPADGVRRVLWWTAKTCPTWNGDNINPVDTFSMHLIGSDGVSRNLAPTTDGNCVPIKDFFPDGKMLQTSTTYVGGVEVVLPAATGTLVLAPPGQGGGWEWPVT